MVRRGKIVSGEVFIHPDKTFGRRKLLEGLAFVSEIPRVSINKFLKTSCAKLTRTGRGSVIGSADDAVRWRAWVSDPVD